MAVAYESISNTNLSSIDGTAKTVGITKPSGLAVGNLMIAIVGLTTAEIDAGTPSGWTKIGEEVFTSGGGHGLYCYYKIADSSDEAAASFTFTPFAGNGGTNDYISGSIIRVSGISPITSSLFFDSAKDSDGGTTNNYTGGVSPLIADSLLIMSVIGRHSAGGAVTVSNYAVTTSNPTWTERQDNTVNDTTDYTLAIATAPRTESTATGDFSVDFSSSISDSVGILLAVIEATSQTVTGSTGILTLNGNAGTVNGSANITGSTGILTLIGNAGTFSNPTPDWLNTDKSSSPSWVNPDKS